ncbi:MAG: CotH kinase family protein, partial [Akkermansiaceae bacterium]
QTSESPWWRNDQYPLSGMLFQESLMAKLNNLTGVPAPEMIHFHFRVVDDSDESNPSDQYDGDFWGIYTCQQHPDKSFFDQNDLPSSNLYKLNNSNNFSKWNQSSTQVEDSSDISSFISGYRNTSDPMWWETNFERHSYYTWNAFNLALNNSDLRPEQNVIYWHHAGTGKWHPCVWDVDLLFEDRQHHNRDPYGFPWEHLHRILDHSAYNIEYQNRVRELQDLLLWNGQYDRSIDEIIGLLTGNGSTTTNTLVDANQAVWERHPRKNYKDGWYRIEGSSYWSGMPDLVNYMKAFAKPGGFGGDQLEGKSQADADSAVPDKPTITYNGIAGYQTTGLGFSTSAFSDGTGSATAIQWRIGEIYDPNVSNYTAGEPWKYEITPVWESGELAWNGTVSDIDIPVTHVKVGRTYRARVRHKDSTGRWSRWSEPHEFLTTAADVTAYRNGLVVSELHYHPSAPTGVELGASLDKDDFEFIELMNVSGAALDLTGVRIADGISFDFSMGSITSLAPGARVLVVENLSAFEARYGSSHPVAGEYSGSLSNGGENIRLSYGDGNTAGNLIREFSYDDAVPWPVAADGTGPSMVLIDPWSVPDHNVGSNWRASDAANGAPGEIDEWSYPVWLLHHGHGGNAAMDDDDNDDLGLLIEYLLGTDPNTDSRESAPASSVESIDTGGGAEDYLVLTFQRDTSADDVSFTVQESRSLDADWNILGTPVLIDSTPQGSGMEALRYRTSQPLSAYPNGKVFMRLMVSE